MPNKVPPPLRNDGRLIDKDIVVLLFSPIYFFFRPFLLYLFAFQSVVHIRMIMKNSTRHVIMEFSLTIPLEILAL
jgi:hypothetical protein